MDANHRGGTPDAEAARQRLAQATLFRDVFAVHINGRRVLAMLEKRFASAAAVVTDGGIDAVLKTYTRAAHREVLDWIHAQIAIAEQGDPTDTPEAKVEGASHG